MKNYENQADFYIQKLISHFNVKTITELSQIIGITQPAISLWKRDNNISAIRKQCKSLGIFDSIFDDFVENQSILNIGSPNSNNNNNGIQFVGKANKSGLTANEQTLLDAYRKAEPDIKTKILVFALTGGKN